MNALLLAINSADIISALNIFWKGMLAIIIVIALIILVTQIMNRVDRGIRKKKQAQNTAQEENKTQTE